MEEKINFLLKKRQKIWLKDGAPKKLKTVAAILDYVLAWGFLFAGSMLLYRFAVAAIGNSIEVVVGGNQSSRLPELSVDYLYVAIILSFFAGQFFKMILAKRGLISEGKDACLEMIELVEKSEEARTYRDGVVNAGLPLLKYDLEKVKEIIFEIENKKLEIEHKKICQKAHGIEC